MKCCDRDCETLFCPYCGRMVCDQGSLDSLLTYLKTSMNRIATRCETSQKKRECSSAFDAARLEEWKTQDEVTLKKWRAWIAAVERAIEREKGTLDGKETPA